MATKVSRLGLFVFAISCFCVVVLCVGLILDWFVVRIGSSGAKEQSGQWEIALVVNNRAIEHSADEMGEEVKKFSESAETVAEFKTMEGRVVRTSASEQLLVIHHESDEVSFSINDATEVQIESEEKSVDNLKKGAKVAVIYRVKNETKHAMKIRTLNDT